MRVITKDYQYNFYDNENYSNISIKLDKFLNRLLIKHSSKKDASYSFFVKEIPCWDNFQQNTILYLNNSKKGIEIKNHLILDFNKLNYKSLMLDLRYTNREDYPFKIDLNSFKENLKVDLFISYEFHLFENLYLFKNLYVKRCLDNIYIQSKFKKTFFEKIITEFNINNKIYESEFLLNLYTIIILQKDGIKFYTKKYFHRNSTNYPITYGEIKRTIEKKIKIDTFINICENYFKLKEHSIEF